MERGREREARSGSIVVAATVVVAVAAAATHCLRLCWAVVVFAFHTQASSLFFSLHI